MSKAMEEETFTAEEVRSWLHKACEEAGGQVFFAKQNGFSAQYVNDIYKGRKEASASMAEALGFARVVIYRPFKPALANLTGGQTDE